MEIYLPLSLDIRAYSKVILRILTKMDALFGLKFML